MCAGANPTLLMITHWVLSSRWSSGFLKEQGYTSTPLYPEKTQLEKKTGRSRNQDRWLMQMKRIGVGILLFPYRLTFCIRATDPSTCIVMAKAIYASHDFPFLQQRIWCVRVEPTSINDTGLASDFKTVWREVHATSLQEGPSIFLCSEEKFAKDERQRHCRAIPARCKGFYNHH